jgi:hypothetical protein
MILSCHDSVLVSIERRCAENRSFLLNSRRRRKPNTKSTVFEPASFPPPGYWCDRGRTTTSVRVLALSADPLLVSRIQSSNPKDTMQALTFVLLQQQRFPESEEYRGHQRLATSEVECKNLHIATPASNSMSVSILGTQTSLLLHQSQSAVYLQIREQAEYREPGANHYFPATLT